MIDRQYIMQALAVMMALALVGQGAVAASAGALNHSNDDANVPNPEIPATLEKDTHDVANMSHPLDYEGNNGDIKSPDARVNDSAANPVSLIATDIEFDDAGAFPHSKSGVSALDQAEWTESGVTVSDTTTAPGVEAVEFATNGSMTTGDSASAEFANFSIDSDAKKRYLSVGLDIATLDSGTTAYVVATDDDGDSKRLVIDSSADAANQSVIANSTGEGMVAQVQLGQLDTVGSGDGSFDSIDSISVETQDGDLTASIAVLNVDKKSPYVFGEKSTDDGAETITEPHGRYSITGVDTLGEAFDQAVIHGLQVEAVFDAASLDSEDVKTETNANDQ